MARGIIWSIIVLSVFALIGCQKKVKEEIPPIEVQAVSLDQSQAAATATPTSTEQMIPGQTAPAAGVTAETIGTAAENAATAVSDTVAIASGVYEKPSIEKIQEALKNAGIYTGSIDGKLGPKTKQAIESFQSQHNLNADGKVGPKTWAKLSQYLAAPSTPTAATVTEPASQINY